MRKRLFALALPVVVVVGVLASPAEAKRVAAPVTVSVENSCLPPSPSFCLVAFIGISGLYTIDGFSVEGQSIVATGTVDGVASIPTGLDFERENFTFTNGTLSRPVRDLTASCAGVRVELGDGTIMFDVPQVGGGLTSTYFDEVTVAFGSGSKRACKVGRLVEHGASAERVSKALNRVLRHP